MPAVPTTGKQSDIKKPRLLAQAGLFHGPGLGEGFMLGLFLGFMLQLNHGVFSLVLGGR